MTGACNCGLYEASKVTMETDDREAPETIGPCEKDFFARIEGSHFKISYRLKSSEGWFP